MKPETQLVTTLSVEKKPQKYPWFWSPIYCAAWFLIFYIAIIPSFYSYPETLLIRDEHLHQDEFIGERAEIQLLGLASIGIKLTGTVENEVLAVNYLLNEIEKIKSTARLDLYDIEVDVQYSSGHFMLWGMATSYRNVSNVVVKLSPKNSNSDSYLLVNAHYDSEVGSPAAADDGVMIVIMLETLRVISHSEKELKNPIVFLLNGAEEANLLASHGFITNHKWATNCKALINLDSAGSGGREVLFQSGPNHPWLMKYYKKSAKHPYATTIAEELFQNDFIPSDSDFRVFRDYGGVPGLDMAHTLNGYIYHTKYDNFQNLERRTCQTTGDNLLPLTRALANAYELRDTDAYSEGHTIFFDYLGWFMVFYTESTGIAINIVCSVSALIAIGVSLFLMTRCKTADSPKKIYIRFFVIFIVQILTVLAAAGITILIAVIIDALGLTQSWYSGEWIIFGLYFCPIFCVLGVFQAIFISWTKKKTNMTLNQTIACFMHAHCIILVFLCLLMTGMGIRSAFFSMIAVFFYTISVILHIINSFWCKKDLFIPVHLVCQLLPYWFYTYLSFAFLKVFVPMQGRDGPTSKPEILVSVFVIIMSIHFSGFIIPILHIFRKGKLFFSSFAALTIVFIIIAATPAAFPYKKDTNPQRFYVLHTNRVQHDYLGNVVKNESGFYIQPVDTRPNTLKDTSFQNAEPDSWIQKVCDEEMFCGLPLYSTRWMEWKNSAKWIPAEIPNLSVPTDLKITEKTFLNDTIVRYNFELNGVDRLAIYIDPYEGKRVIDWTFDRTPIEENYETPYFLYHVYSFVEEPLKFYIDIQREDINNHTPDVQISVSGHYLHHHQYYTEEFKGFLDTFPDWTYTTDWFASYESWII